MASIDLYRNPTSKHANNMKYISHILHRGLKKDVDSIVIHVCVVYGPETLNIQFSIPQIYLYRL